MTWFDTGTVESLDDATEFVRVLQRNQSTMIACLEEIAYKMGYIDKNQLENTVKDYGKGKYGEYLRNITKDL